MTPTSPAMPADWLREHTTTLNTLDSDGGLDDLEPLREVIADARVVSIGENAHFVEEFSAVRQRVMRFLAERCGFSVFAFEFSFADAFDLDRWLNGQDTRSLGDVSPAAADWGADGLMHWLREHNHSSTNPLRFVGIDVPEAGGALRPVLEPLAEYLRTADPDSLPLVESALRISDSFLTNLGSAATAAPAWSQLESSQQNALTAALARLQLRLRAIEPLAITRGDTYRYKIAERMLAAACTVDYMLRAMNELYSGMSITADLSVRELYMAETVRWHLEHADPSTRIVLAAHNNHIQKTANEFVGTVTALPMGQHLARMLGEDYVAIGVTHTADHIPEMYPDATTSVGFTIADAELPAPQQGSIEAGLIDAGLGQTSTVTNLREAPVAAHDNPQLTSIRTQSEVMHTPVPAAFDAAISTPTVTKDHKVKF